MKTSDMRAKARAIFGSAVAEPMPNQPNGAKALQQRANARPIPTYKVGGVVKKPMPAASAASGNRMAKQEADEMRFMDMMDKKKKSAMPSPAASAASGNRMAREEGAEMRKMKMAKGGKLPDLTGDGKVTRADVLKGRGVKGFSKGGMEKGGMPKGASKNKGPVRKYGEGGLPMGQATAAYGARLREEVKRGNMTNAQAQALHNANIKNKMAEMARRTAGRELPTQTGAQQAAAAYRDTGARLNEQVKAGQITPQQATAMARPAFMATTKNSPIVQSTMAQAAVPPLQRAKGGKVQTSSDTARKLASEMGGMKKGGKVKPVELDMKMLEEMSRPKMSLPNLESKVAEARNLNTVRAKETSDATKKQSFKEAFAEARRDQGANGVFTWRGNTYNTKMAGETSKAAPARAAAPARGGPPAAAAPTTSGMSDVEIRNFTKGLNADADSSIAAANPTRAAAAPVKPRVGLRNTELGSYFADILDKERARNAESNKKLVERYNSEGRPRLAKAVSFLSGAEYAKGGKVKEAKPKNGLAVMIAIGKPMKPAKKMNGGPMAERSTDMESSKVTRNMAMGGDPMGYMDGGAPMGYAAGGAGKTRKGQAPIKKAQGGAAKVRKGMMTPEGDIINAMNKMRGK